MDRPTRSTTQDARRQVPAITRRGAIASMIAIGAAPLLASAQQDEDSTVATATADSEIIGEATMPQWRFVVLEMQDPFTGTLTRPTVLEANKRVVALHVILSNESDQPLEFMASDFRLRDTEGTEYRGGDHIGTEPRIVSQNLPDGERTRGWVWFGLPIEAVAANMVFVAPPPVLRVPLG